MVAYAGSFLLGGVSALLLMGLLLFCMEHPVKKPKDNQFLKQIADALEALPELQEPQEILPSAGVETSGALKFLPENSPAKDHGAAARRLDMGYNPVPELL
ncbi:MAG: hypothetical protein WBV23_01195 [Desulfobaccales bacterium]